MQNLFNKTIIALVLSLGFMTITFAEDGEGKQVIIKNPSLLKNLKPAINPGRDQLSPMILSMTREETTKKTTRINQNMKSRFGSY